MKTFILALCTAILIMAGTLWAITQPLTTHT
jgi:hypothetical protein